MPDESDPNVHRVQINSLFEQLARMREDMRDGFTDLRQLLDARLQSKDEELDDHESRIRSLERATARQTVINGVLSALGGAALALAVRVLAGGG